MTEAEMFMNALEMENDGQRESYLTEVCGNNLNLKERLLKLLRYSDTTGGFLEAPAILSQSSEEFGPYEVVGQCIGPYKLLQKIGEGGMGTVFMADQQMPVKRLVALKVIKPGMDTDQVVARFETERQSLVLMDHPNIARALDVGTTERGRPYFVMELVKGVPINRYCDQKRLNTEQRLSLFIPVCLAVQHAHLKGVIHRDLKPSNVLVAEYDEQAVPKVIDFGVAKAMDKQLASQTMFTQYGQIIGTVEYLSPEQSKLNQLDVDTRSDVYSLGVMLYELLTGSTPIQSKFLKDVAWDELAQMIREEEPPVPSVRISTAETIEDIAGCRQTEPGKLSRLVRGELDWIVMKALEKDRSRRYQSANELALDVQRYLDNEAVEACPPSSLYQLSKFARRHQVLIGSTALISSSLLLGLVGTVWQAREARLAKVLAETQRDIARSENQRAHEAELAASRAAEQSKRDAEVSQAIGKFVNNDLLAFANPDIEPDRNILLRTLLDRAARSVAESKQAPEVESALRFTLATAYLNLGEYREANEHALQSLELRRAAYGDSHSDSLESLLLTAEIQLKRSCFHDASRSFQISIDLCREMNGNRRELSLRSLQGLGVAWFRSGRLDAADDLLKELTKTQTEVLGGKHRDTLETRRELAEIQYAKGYYRNALVAFSTLATEMADALGESHPLTLKTKAGQATVLMTLGRLEDARLLREKIFESQSEVLGTDHPETLTTASALATVSLKKGELKQAEQLQRKLLSNAQARLGDRNLVTIQLSNTLAEILAEQGGLKEAKQLYEKSLSEINELLDQNNPLSLQLKFRLAGMVAFSGHYDEALSRYREVLEAQRLVLSRYHVDTLHSLSAISEILMNQGRYAECQSIVDELIHDAEQSLGEIHPIALHARAKSFTLKCMIGNKQTHIDAFSKLVSLSDQEHGQASPISIELAVGLAETLERLGFADQALAMYERRLQHSMELFGKEHSSSLRIRDSMATALHSLGRFTEARKINEEVLAVRRQTIGMMHPLALRSLNNLGSCLVMLGETAKAEKMLRQAYHMSKEQFGPSFPATLQYGQNLASTLGVLKQGVESLQLYEEILGTQIRLLGDSHPDTLHTKLGLAGAYAHQERFVDAERLYLRVLEDQRKMLGASHPNTLRCLENLTMVIGEQHRYPDAISRCNEYLAIAREKYPASPSVLKMIHAAIEYHIVQGKTLDAKPFFEQSMELVNRFEAKPDWLINDLRFLAYAYIQAGEYAQVESTFASYAAYCRKKFGVLHPTTFQAEVLIANAMRTQAVEKADKILSAVQVHLKTAQASSQDDDKRWRLVNALANRNHVDLEEFAEEAFSQMEWTKAAMLFGQCAAFSSDSPQGSVETKHYRDRAIAALQHASQGGRHVSDREFELIKIAPELYALRSLPEFVSLLSKIKSKMEVEHLLKMAWSHAKASDVAHAKKLLQDAFANVLDNDQKSLANYNAACVYSICYGAMERDAEKLQESNSCESANWYLNRAIERLEDCFADRFFESTENAAQFMRDNDLDPIRSTQQFKTILLRLNQ